MIEQLIARVFHDRNVAHWDHWRAPTLAVHLELEEFYKDAIKALAQQCDVVIVVGSPNSSNSNRLREVAANQGIAAYMVDNARELKPE